MPENTIINHTEQSDETEHENQSSQATTNHTCEECNGTLRENEQHGEYVCEDCGLVADETVIDRGPEWRAFNSSDRDEKSRVGAPTTNTLHDKGLSTNIGWQDKDAYGNSLSATQRQKMQRLRTWNERFRTEDSKDRNLKQALGEISRMASALGLNQQVEETAGVLYRKCLDEDLLPGRSIEGMATACLYAASRQCNMPRSLDEIYPVSRVYNESQSQDNSSNEIDRAYRYIAQELGLQMEPVDPRQYLNRFLSNLDIENDDTTGADDKKEQFRQKACELLDYAEQENLHSGKSPTSLAAAAIYAASILVKPKLTQTEVANVSDVSEVTIRNRYQEMIDAYPHSKLFD